MSVDKLLKGLANKVEMVESEQKKPSVKKPEEERIDFGMIKEESNVKNEPSDLLKSIFGKDAGKVNTGGDEDDIRLIIREEMEKFFSNKTVLTEEKADGPQTIFLKIGEHIFKGTMELVK